MRHAFRNALMPLASIVPVDIITLIGGAVSPRRSSAGRDGPAVRGLLGDDQTDPVMAYIVIVGILAVLANFVADLDLRRTRPADPGGSMSIQMKSTEPAGHDTVENAIELKDVEGLSQGQIVRRRFFRHRGRPRAGSSCWR